VAKVDTLRLRELAEIEVRQLQSRGRWMAETMEARSACPRAPEPHQPRRLAAG